LYNSLVALLTSLDFENNYDYSTQATTPSQLKGMVGYWKAIYPIMGRDENKALDISTIPPNLMKNMRFLECAGQGKAT